MKNLNKLFDYSTSGVSKYLDAFKTRHWLDRDIYTASVRGETTLSVELEDLRELENTILKRLLRMKENGVQNETLNIF